MKNSTTPRTMTLVWPRVIVFLPVLSRLPKKKMAAPAIIRATPHIGLMWTSASK